ncbi:hypothetical protein P7C70_g5436, partial [Phenoliferia sp. Uapishka_3]
MAQLQRTISASPSRTHQALPDISELELSSSAVPTPFPEQARKSSRSPSASRGLGGLVDSFKRSFSKERGNSIDRTRTRDSRSESTIAEEDEKPRGRTNPLHQVQTNTTTRSTSSSRGRAPALSTGRGGAGNMLPPELISRGSEEGDDVILAREKEKSRSLSRGREEVIVGGRGGRGNMRNASRQREVENTKERSEEREREDRLEREVLERSDKVKEERVWSTGRGGAGNMRANASSKERKV